MNHRRIVCVTTVGILSALVMTVQCQKRLPHGVLAQEEIRADKGGRVETSDGKLVLEIPANALSGNTTVTIAQVDSPPAYPDYDFLASAGTCYNIEIGAVAILDSITVTAKVDGVPAGSTASLAFFDTTYDCWAFVGDRGGAAAGWVSTKTQHLSDWWTFYFTPPTISDKKLAVPYYDQFNCEWCAPTSMAMEMKYLSRDAESYEVASAFGLEPNQGVSPLEPVLLKAASVWRDFLGVGPYRFYFVGPDSRAVMRYVLGNLVQAGHPATLWSPRTLPGHVIVVTGWSTEAAFFHDPSGAYEAGTIQATLSWEAFFDKTKTIANWVDALPLSAAPDNARRGSLQLSYLAFGTANSWMPITFDGRYPCGYYYRDPGSVFPDDPNEDGLRLENMPQTTDGLRLSFNMYNVTPLARSYTATARVIDRSTGSTAAIMRDTTTLVGPLRALGIIMYDELEPFGLGGLTPGRYSVRVSLTENGFLQDSFTVCFNLADGGGGGNNPPETPTVPSGPDSGWVDVSYSFSSSATDPDGDSVTLRFSWGDGDTSAWSGLVGSGASATMAHAWSTAGSYDVKAQAKDVQGASSSWSSRLQVNIIDGGGGYPDTVVATVSVGTNPTGIAALPNNSYVYAANQGDNSVSVIRTSDNTVVATVSVGTEPAGVAVVPNGSVFYVANQGDNSVSVIRTSDNSVVATVPVGEYPQGLAVLPNGSYVYVTNAFDGSVSVIRTSDNTVVATVSTGSGSVPNGLASLPDGSYVYVACYNNNLGFVSVIRTSDNTVVASVGDVGGGPVGVAALPSGGYVYVTNINYNNVWVIRTSDNTVVAAVPVSSGVDGVATLPNGRYVYTTGANAVSVIRASDNTVVATVPDSYGCGSVTALPNGSCVYATGYGDSSVSVIGFRSLGAAELNKGFKGD